MRTYYKLSCVLIGMLLSLLVRAETRGDVGGPLEIFGKRILCLDELYVEQKENLKPVLHQPEKHENNPVLRADKPWEKVGLQAGFVLRDSQDGLFKTWYRSISRLGNDINSDTGARFHHCYATSRDGIHWDKPNLGLYEFDGVKETNLFMGEGPYPIGLITPVMHEPKPEKKLAGFKGGGDELPVAKGGYKIEFVVTGRAELYAFGSKN